MYVLARIFISSSFKLSRKMIQAPAAERNKEQILKVIKQHVPQTIQGSGLEIASGTGSHITLFAQHYTDVVWQPSDIEKESLNSISAYKTHFNVTNVKDPCKIDITTPVEKWEGDFTEKSTDIMVNINMIHISPWATAMGLFKAARVLLKPKGHLFLYGPFAVDGKLTPESNVNFDLRLKSQNADWGIRDLTDVQKLATENGMMLKQIHEMPANNKTLVFQKD